jgi:hypothetical protein
MVRVSLKTNWAKGDKVSGAVPRHPEEEQARVVDQTGSLRTAQNLNDFLLLLRGERSHPGRKIVSIWGRPLGPEIYAPHPRGREQGSHNSGGSGSKAFDTDGNSVQELVGE